MDPSPYGRYALCYTILGLMNRTKWLYLAVIGFIIANLTVLNPTPITIGLVIGLVVYNATYAFFLKYLNND